VPFERSGVPLEGGRADCLVGRWGHQGRGPGCWAVSYLKRVLGSFVFCFLRKKVGFPWLFRGPLWLSPTVAPEHLRVYLLGSRRCWRLLMGLSSLLVDVLFRGVALADPWV
jgi:hypothetical protein